MRSAMRINIDRMSGQILQSGPVCRGEVIKRGTDSSTSNSGGYVCNNIAYMQTVGLGEHTKGVLDDGWTCTE